MEFRKAKNDEIPSLNLLIKESKGHWGYTEEFCQAFIEKWGISSDFFNTGILEALCDGDDIVGIIGMIPTEEYPILDYFFIKPAYIGRGLGKKMWEHVIKIAAEQNWKTFRFISDPNSEAIYKHFGAQTIGKVESFPGRFVPLMEYKMVE